MLVTTRAQLSRRPTKEARPANPDAVSATEPGLSDLGDGNEREIDEFDDDVWDDTDDVDSFDIQRSADESSMAHPEVDKLLSPLTFDGLSEAQCTIEFCKTVISRQSKSKEGAFFKDTGGSLKRRMPSDKNFV